MRALAPRATLPSMGLIATNGPIDLVTFDLYDTLIELHPPRWERLAAAARKQGIDADAIALREADRIAEDYFTIENGRLPIRDREKPEREAFRLELMRRWLEAAGLPHDPETTRAMRQAYISEFDEVPDHHHYRLFDDVLPALRTLRRAGVNRGHLQRGRRRDCRLYPLCLCAADGSHRHLGARRLRKPDPRTYQAALEPLEIDPERAIHVGDQPKSDVVGALGVGMGAVLIDRYDRHDGADLPTVSHSHELADMVVAARRPVR